MPSLLPSRSNNYQVTVLFQISSEVWNAAVPDIAERLTAVEDVVQQGYTVAQEAGTAMAEAIIRDSIAPQVADVNATIADFETRLSLAQDQLAALQNGGVEAVNVPLAPYGLFVAGTDAQEAFELISDYLDDYGAGIDELQTGKMEKSARGAANGVAPLGADQKVPDANIQGDTLRVGEIFYSATQTPPPKALKADGAKYLKSAYPELAAVMRPSLQVMSGSMINTGINPTTTIGGSAIGGDYAVAVGEGEILTLNIKTGQFARHVPTAPITSNYWGQWVEYNPDDGLFYCLFHYPSSSVTAIRTINAATGVMTTVSHNLPAGIFPRFVVKIDGFWYISLGGTLYRGASLSSLAVVGGTIGPQIISPPVKAGDGTMYALNNSAALALHKSIDNGATWSLHEALGSFDQVGVSGRPTETMIVEWKGQVYFRADASSTATTGYLYRVNPVGASTLMLAKDKIGQSTPTSWGMNKIADLYLMIGRSLADGSEGVVLDDNGNIVPISDLFAVLGDPADNQFVSFLGASVMDHHPTYGFIRWNSSSGQYWRFHPDYNYDTEMRVPKAPPTGGGAFGYIKALP